ncbi:MAG: hypothetical protein R3C69_04115 [Geminicoccaceae bacterium]
MTTAVLVRSYSLASGCRAAESVTSKSGNVRRQELADTSLVGAVAVAADEADRDRGDAQRLQPPAGLQHLRVDERCEHRPVGGDPLGHLEPGAPRHQGLGLGPGEIEHLGRAHPADLEDVAKPLGGDQPGRRPGALEERVRADGRAMQDFDHLPAIDAGLGHDRANPVEHGGLGRRAGRGDLGGQHLAVPLAQHEVGEGAADIRGDPDRPIARSRQAHAPHP